MEDDGGWKRRGSRHLYESRWFNVRQDEITLPSGEQVTYTVVEHPGYAVVVPLRDDGQVVLERIYRYAVRRTLLECPSGGLDGDPPDRAARRELEEETGLVAGRLTPLGSFYGSSGISGERFHVYLARDLEDTGRLQRESTEQIELELLPFESAARMAFAGEIEDAATTLALILADRLLRSER